MAGLRTRAWEAAAETRRQTRNGRVGSIFICNLRASAQCRLLPSRAFKRLTTYHQWRSYRWQSIRMNKVPHPYMPITRAHGVLCTIWAPSLCAVDLPNDAVYSRSTVMLPVPMRGLIYILSARENILLQYMTISAREEARSNS